MSMQVCILTLTATGEILDVCTNQANEGITYNPAIHTRHTEPMSTFAAGGGPIIGGTFDGATFTPATKADYLIFKDGATELGFDELLTFAHTAAKVITVQKKDGATDADKTGTETIDIEAVDAVIAISASSITLVGGSQTFTVGPQATDQRGCATLEARDQGGALTFRRLKIRMT